MATDETDKLLSDWLDDASDEQLRARIAALLEDPQALDQLRQWAKLGTLLQSASAAFNGIIDWEAQKAGIIERLRSAKTPRSEGGSIPGQ
jgi:hypothetical protein